MIDLYYWPTPNGHKITIALEEMALDYQLFPINILENDQFQSDFLAISPNNKIPAIVDHDGPQGKSIAIFESGAILQYLGRKTGLFYPSDEVQKIEVEKWLMWQMGGLGPMLGQNHHFSRFAPERIAYATDRYVNETKRLYKVLDQHLQGQDYVTKDYSIADMAILPWLLRHEWQQIELRDYPHVHRYIDRLSERPAIQKALSIQLNRED